MFDFVGKLVVHCVPIRDSSYLRHRCNNKKYALMSAMS